MPFTSQDNRLVPASHLSGYRWYEGALSFLDGLIELPTKKPT